MHVQLSASSSCGRTRGLLSVPSALTISRRSLAPLLCTANTSRSLWRSQVCFLHHIASVAILHQWPYCIGGHIALVAVLHRWPYHAWGHIASVTISHRWPYHIRGHIASVAILHRWSYCVCAHVHMHMHGYMHAAGMQVYAGGMCNIEYRTKLRHTAQEQLGFSISSSRSSKYAQSVHTAQKNATHACLATAHFWAPPSVAM